MFTNRIEDLWRGAATDGASTPPGQSAVANETELQGMLAAWLVERQSAIDFELLLKQSRKLIAGVIADGECSASVLRKAQRLIRSIDRSIEKRR